MQSTSYRSETGAQSKTGHPGLSAVQVAERKLRGETNDYRARIGRGYIRIFQDNVLNLFNIVLGTLLIIIVNFGDFATAFFAGFSVVTNSFFGMIQEIRAKRKLDKLAALSEQEVQVWRDGQLQMIPMRQVVKDDVIAIEPGDRFVVDGVVLTSDSMEVDESLLTGESDSVFKQEGDEVFSGSFCVAGAGLIRATRVGAASNVNQLSMIAKQYKNVKTPTQRKIDIIVELSVVFMFIFVPMMFISANATGLNFLQMIRNAVVFVTSLVPQGLVLVAILSLTIGAIRISRYQTLIQKVNAVESLANATVLCFDKTGTLTKNQLAVTEIIPLNNCSLAEVHHKLRLYLENLAHKNRTAGAVDDYIRKLNLNNAVIEKEREIPFTSERKWGAVVLPDSQTLIMGAPERILPQNVSRDKPGKQAAQLSRKGMRVLAFAQMAGEPENGHVVEHAQPLALIVLSDQIREDIRETLRSFTEEGIRLKVISGDNLETVKAIARQSGMRVAGAYNGTELEKMPDSEFEEVVAGANVFARIGPDTKRRIVTALQKQGEYVAMVGDGVNDVPALKQANLAIVMNAGSQISKDIADIVLLNNAMSTLPLAFREGREITQTIFGTTKLFLARNFYYVVFFVFIAFMSLPFPITPIQISWSTFGVVNIPATLIAFAYLRPEFMKSFRQDVLDYIFTTGVIVAVTTVGVYLVAYFASERDIHITRSAVTIYMTLISMLVMWNTLGVDFYRPRAFIQRWRVMLLGAILCGLTIVSLYLMPDLFEFVPAVSENKLIVAAIVILFDLTLILVAHGMRHRYLLNRMWELFEE